MKRILLATAASAVLATAASAQETANVGIILGFTGPLESITPGDGRQRPSSRSRRRPTPASCRAA